MIPRNVQTVRRINVLKRILASSNSAVNGSNCFVGWHRSTSTSATIRIDDVEKQIHPPKQPELVPSGYVNVKAETGEAQLSQTRLHHLRWMLQKDNLGQDMILLGRPGNLRRNLIMQYSELTRREVEYILLNRDTTESDLKQRREIKDGTATYYNQSAVRAATEGRILVIEGVEKTERNVLPILNNLLENREMHLEDGRFLISAKNYDSLLERFNREQLDKWGLVRVSEDFRVIALGLPVPKYRGSPLDPPLRSRFQARDVSELPYLDILTEVKQLAGNKSPDVLTKLTSFGFSVLSSASTLPDFPVDNLRYVGMLIDNNPHLSEFSLLNRLYPFPVFLEKEGVSLTMSLMESLKITPEKEASSEIISVEPDNEDSLLINLKVNSHPISFTIRKCKSDVRSPPTSYRKTNYQQNLLAELIQSAAVGDVCLIGPKGCGKSILVNELCSLLGQEIETMVLYQDMTARDLIQKRTTKLNGDTIWQDSSLLLAALNGHVIVLDGINRLHHSTLAILHRLIHDREMQLYDGRRLMRHDRYDRLLEMGFTGEDLSARGILRIDPAFRIIAMAEPHKKSGGTNWMNPETLNLFLFHEIRGLSRDEELRVIDSLYGPLDDTMHQILKVAQYLRGAQDTTMRNLAENLSTRQLLRIARRLHEYGEHLSDRSACSILHNTFLTKFMPNLPRSVLENALRACDVSQGKERRPEDVAISTDNGVLQIGNTSVPIYQTEAVSKVPDIVFYNVPQHVKLMERLLQDFTLGEHLLLVGNQGVGKNKIADRLLQLMNRPREYIQLHRDTTVQSLTLQASIRDGRIIYEDSPLVKAVTKGHVLVVDEADKAPIHVTCILKTLVENGEMMLSDGRKICPPSKTPSSENDKLIYTHLDFRMIVLANRPGFPFLGNDFFAALGDLFSCHAVDNPSPNSEIYLLKQYGPDVPDDTIRQLVDAFSELRDMADSGILSYPYSTREVVNIVKHLQKFPDDNMAELIGNVLDYDRYAPETLDQVTGVLLKHGLAIAPYAKNELAALRRQREIQMTVQANSGKDVSSPKHGKVDPNNDPHVGGNTWAGGSGGRDTAGLGGKGGPYRLDSGHKVHQLSDAEKDDIPEHVKRAAREMNRKAFEEKLKEIQMSGYDHKVYMEFSGPVQKQVQQLRVILQALQAKSKERHWQKHQTSGEMDDTKLVEGITGEKNIYKRRVEQDPEPGQPQEKPKRLKLVVDVSGSMYRFNGYDGRLDRQLEAVVMVMEAFDGFETKIKYDIVGHSGEAVEIPFINVSNPPKDDKRRLETIKMMHAHSQFCWSGDHTLPAARNAVDGMAKEECDEAIVVVLSDANLSRYGISPRNLNDILQKQSPKVQAYVIFIGSLGDEAQLITNNMTAGKSFVCMNLEQLPQILKQIFTASVLQ
ncbi:von Willebrand factor A domain-containing protein 8 [Toxorhynchites rutilus septentrionalis]|uniref:von Willebrand factor A domain-containing protein 8 n=1 Tax=Toxorhynchites rutilus septentrionalis TaxID=329112 RepID=UPI0024796AE2|nr:von Willebrand factor A domain-containing protein 8 [Toxorhynchites rutilus septentrionalis]XP_055616058.1 von Willebrand factor A domain-containing protein 8 [Toxorhynchites rutilus septentrionalis]